MGECHRGGKCEYDGEQRWEKHCESVLVTKLVVMALDNFCRGGIVAFEDLLKLGFFLESPSAFFESTTARSWSFSSLHAVLRRVDW